MQQTELFELILNNRLIFVILQASNPPHPKRSPPTYHPGKTDRFISRFQTPFDFPSGFSRVPLRIYPVVSPCLPRAKSLEQTGLNSALRSTKRYPVVLAFRSISQDRSLPAGIDPHYIWSL